MTLEFLKAVFTDLMKSVKGENELYDHTDGQFMYFEKNRSHTRPPSNKELREIKELQSKKTN